MATSELTTVNYLLVETMGWWDGGGDGFLRAAGVLAGTGRRVVVVLVQDAVSAVVAAPSLLRRVLDAGAAVLVDDFSLRQRALTDADVPDWVEVVDAERIAELVLVAGVKVVWH